VVSSSTHGLPMSGVRAENGLPGAQICNSPLELSAAGPGRHRHQQGEQQQQQQLAEQPSHHSSSSSHTETRPSGSTVCLGDTQQQQQQQQQQQATVASPQAAYPLSCAAADLLAASTAGLLTGISLWKVITGAPGGATSLFSTQPMYVAVLLGPVGCLLRFYLAPLNGSCKGRWTWFPAGEPAATSCGVLSSCPAAGLVVVMACSRPHVCSTKVPWLPFDPLTVS
jgi:hypothetical protein